ncbi:hypothetical protein GA830_17960 [Mesorhizobium sp. NBSH29]|uniref:hypothetical protein n=1 Tax=Mesorhizobium sp. NBSH29 TaxID=2654249 RepID=UPI0018965BD6|nr:hypothetical protein [Mesorhizobium sp. NBSH29]QPC88429.1 hypothetical protein GA830_17960 [Mesorhizobium sp. NBSH29]
MTRTASPRSALHLAALMALALAACTSPEKALDPSAIKPVDSVDATVDAAATSAAPSTAPGASLAQTSIQLAPVVGPTVEAAKPLSARIVEKVAERGIILAGANGTPTLVLKGYFSAMTEAGQTTVIYVWDVLDTSGNRLHRIQGQEKASANAGDGWETVTAPMMQAIADQTVDKLSTWLATRDG